MESDRVEVMDLYLAAYYLIRGCSLESVRYIPTGNTASCSLMIVGDRTVLRAAMETFFASQAEVNLLDFRHAYNRVNTAIHQAKRDAGKLRSGNTFPQGGSL